MSAVTCPLAGWDYTTDDNDPVLTQLNLHALSHTLTSTSTEPVKQEPQKTQNLKRDVWKGVKHLP